MRGTPGALFISEGDKSCGEDAETSERCAALSFLRRRVMTRWAPIETLTILDPRTTSTVLSECSDM